MIIFLIEFDVQLNFNRHDVSNLLGKMLSIADRLFGLVSWRSRNYDVGDNKLLDQVRYVQIINSKS